MGIFQNSVINKYLEQQNKKDLSNAFNIYSSYFHNPEIQNNIRAAKEEQFQEGFLRELFVNVLGYTLNPQVNYNLTTEQKNLKGSKKADGAILDENGNVIAVIELKGTNTSDLDRINDQAFGYKNNQPHCIYVITSNFEKLRFFIHNAVEHIEFDLFSLKQKDFEVLWFCLQVDNVLAVKPEKAKNESIVVEERITKQLYRDYSYFKNDLWNEILKKKKNNQDELILYKKTQKLLDRFLFILFSEDSGLLPPNSVTTMIERWEKLKELDAYKPLYDIFRQYFGYIDEGKKGLTEVDDIYPYNGGLFLPDEILDNICIDDKILYSHLNKLTSYDFQTEIDVNILGHIFENSLSDIEEVKAKIQGEVVKKSKTKKNKDGIFYTPKYITKFMVDNTIGILCEQSKSELGIVEEEYAKGSKRRRKKTVKDLHDRLNKYRDWLLNIKICDPACGSGAFLNQALEFLIQEHSYVDTLESKLFNSGFVFRYVSDHILENNLYGVDINEESIAIAKLSLWLRTAQKGRKLTSLNNNIKCGDSLIEDIEISQDKAFVWEKEFPEVFLQKGFDIVIGNPPYVDVKSLRKNVVDYLFSNYTNVNNRVNLFAAFTEKSLNLIKSNGMFSFIVPSSILTQQTYKSLRSDILESTLINGIVRLPNESFGGAAGDVKVDTVILTLQRQQQPINETQVIVYEGFDRINEISRNNADSTFNIDQKVWDDDIDKIFRINVDNKIISILETCKSNSQSLIECAEFCLGLTPYDKYKGHTQEQIKNKAFHANSKKDSTYKKLLAGNDIKRYSVSWNESQWISYGDWLGAPREQRFFTQKRILVKQIIDWTDKKIWAALTDDELYNTQNAFNLIARDGYEPEYLLAIINSTLMSFYHRKTFLDEYKDRFQKILIKDAKAFPIKNVSNEEQKNIKYKVHKLIEYKESIEAKIRQYIEYILASENIESVSKKLSKWPRLNFSEFISELNKCLKKSGKNKLSKKDEIEWLGIFKEHRESVQAYTDQYDLLDHEINSMIYNIYGLSKEDIKVIEKT